MSLLTAVTALAIFAGAALQSATGFGFGLVAAPLLFAATSPEEAVGLMMLLGLEINTLTLLGEKRRPEPLRSEAMALIAWAVPGMLVGVLVLRSLDAATLQVIVTVGVLASLAVRRIRPAPGAPGRLTLPAAGLASGALNTATSTSGPPLVLYLLRRRAAPGQVRDTLTVVFLAFSFLGAAALAVTQTSEAIPGWGWVAGLVPLVFAGHRAGRKGFARLTGGRYELALTFVLVAAAMTGLATALW